MDFEYCDPNQELRIEKNRMIYEQTIICENIAVKRRILQ